MFEEIDKLYEEIHRIAKECVNKNVLNENEQFCLACINGAEVKFETNIEGKLQLVIKDKISFYKENGEWKMIIRKTGFHNLQK
jgi:hypothetical protein